MSPVPGLGQQSDVDWQAMVVVVDQLIMQHWLVVPHTTPDPWQSLLLVHAAPIPPPVDGATQVLALAPDVLQVRPVQQSPWAVQLWPLALQLFTTNIDAVGGVPLPGPG